LGGQRAAARYARVHFDDELLAGFGVNGELDIRPAGVDADRADDRLGGVAHALVFLVGERLGGGDGDGVARVHTHGVEVLDGADDHDVVVAIAHHFQFVFLPADDRLIDEDLSGHGGVQAAADDVLELLAVVGDAATGAAEGERGADDGGQLHFLKHLPGFFHGVGDARAWHGQADRLDDLLEDLAVLGAVDDLAGRADHLAAVFGQRAVGGEGAGAGECGLTAERGQQGVDLVGAAIFTVDDLGDGLGCDRLDIGAIRELRIGHDGGGVGVDQDDLVALLLQCLAGLGAGVVKLAALADDD